MASKPIITQDPFPPSTGKPLLRPRNVILAILFALIAGVGVWAYTIATLTPGKPGRFTDEINTFVADAQATTAGKPNLWDEVSQAAQMTSDLSRKLVDRPRPAGLPADYEVPNIGWPLSPEQIANPNITKQATPEVHAEILAIIKEHEDSGILDKLDKIVEGERFIRVIPGDQRVLEVLLPELGGMRGIARLCKARMFLAAEAGDSKEFIRSARHAWALGEIAKKQATLIDHLVGVAIDALVANCIREAIVKKQLSPETCAALLAELNKRATTFDPVRGLHVEHLSAKDTVEWTHSDDGNGNGRFIGAGAIQQMAGPGGAGPNLPPALTNFASVILPTKKETLAIFEDLFGKASAYAKLTLRERLASAAPDDEVDKISKRHILPRILMPALGRYISMSEQAHLTAQGTKILLALEIHKGAKGSYPKSLAELEPGLASLGVEERWIKELRYKLLPEGSDPDGRGYLLYWIGVDGVDNDGLAHPKEGSIAAWRTKFAGFDLVFNEPAEKPAPPAPPEPAPEAGESTTVPLEPAPK
ncbi:MAG: hypothetical protein HEQ23_10625 [Tepidisphaera sp.]